MSQKIDRNMIVRLNEEECTLGEAMKKCRAGDIIEGLGYSMVDILITNLQKEQNNPTYSFCTDRRYGEWRIILTGRRDKLIKE
jgi:hypothetical protein